ncbi:MAG: bifunctional oligoribonuclease/PAP phosphatase NrnA [Flavobacteriales bacterium]|nr:bifunctional oligoribonuclease/PAP phosphatase NrnA [Flavobacteriales bacterium]
MSLSLNAGQVAKAKQLISEAKSIVITTHKSPDGDAIGSSLALYLVLKSMGKKTTVIVPDDIPEYLQWMKGCDEIVVHFHHKEKAEAIVADADLIFMLDHNHLSRTGDMENGLRNAKADFILVDHHQQPEQFAKVIYSDTASCSTCEMLYKFIVWLGEKERIDPYTGECLYCGIMTDSGSFRFPAVTAETHLIAANLIERGVDHAQIHREIFDTNPKDRLKLMGYALNEKLEVMEDCATAIISLTQDELKRFNYRPGDTEGLANQALSVKGIKLAAFFREGNNEIKISFRSKSSFDVNQLAREGWKGGGHVNAAGGSSTDTLENTLNTFRQQARSLSSSIINS